MSPITVVEYTIFVFTACDIVVVAVVDGVEPHPARKSAPSSSAVRFTRLALRESGLLEQLLPLDGHLLCR
jgi:hypothetical protein